jgi:nucleoside-diphosphate-sugar epimerase
MNVFQAARELGVRKVVFISSIQVIGGDRHYFEEPGKTPPSMLKYLPIDGDTPPNPRNPYSLSKLAGEKLCEFYLAPAGIEATAVRLPWTSHPDWWGYMKRRRSDKVRDHTLIDECLAYLHAEDAGRLMLAILRATLPGFRVYQPAAKSLMFGISVAEAVERFYQGVELRKPVSEMTSLVDLSQITRETGWEPQFDASQP